MRKNKGITLIALIITIIIMLILVAVSVNVLIKSNLIGTAETTVNKYKTASEEESNGGKITIGGKEYASIDDYLKKDTHDWQYTDNTRAQIRCTCENCKAFNDGDSTGRTLSIGQQIGKTESKTASTSITGEKSGVSQGITDGNLTSSDYGTNGSQTLTLNGEETKWVVFGYEDRDNDGANETLLLTTEYPTNNIVFYGAAAYNNAVDEINRMCKELYGTNARGMTIEDVNRVLGYTPTGGMYYLNSTYYTTENLTTKLKDLGEMWTALKNNNDTNYSGKYYDPSHTEGISDNGEALGEYELNGYWYAADQSLNVPTGVKSVASKISSAAKAMVFGSDCDYNYWLASRGIGAYSDFAFFGPGAVFYGRSFSYSVLFGSDGIASSYGLRLRPLVSLTSEIPAAGDVLFSTFTPPTPPTPPGNISGNTSGNSTGNYNGV